jgi:hypothetical protein
MHGGRAVSKRISEAVWGHDTKAQLTAVPAVAIDAIGVACAPRTAGRQGCGRAGDYDHLNLVMPWGWPPKRREVAPSNCSRRCSPPDRGPGRGG